MSDIKSPIITLTTDFGLKDGNVGAMKGVIWSLAPHAQIADLSHLVAPQNIQEAALILARAAPYFPRGAIHVAVVDPGVGTARRPIALRLGLLGRLSSPDNLPPPVSTACDQYFVGPDNGIFTPLLESAERYGLPILAIHLDQPQYWLPEVSHVFHGRDIFAPVAAHLACGVPLAKLGTPITDPLRLPFPQPEKTASGLRGQVIHIDHFGNIATNILREHLGESPAATISLCGVKIHGMVHTFGERPPGALIALYGSSGNLIVSVVNGSAAQRLGARVGDQLDVIF